MHTIACVNQKGGVGKTTTVANLGAYLAFLGKKVLLIDIDPQANLTSGLHSVDRKDKPSEDGYRFSNTVYDILTKRKTINEVFISTDIKNLFIVPSSIELAGAEVELVSALSRETILKHAINNLKEDFDYILIDCPPSLSILTVNALVASDKVIIPVQCEYYALEGLSQLINTINLIKSNINPTLEIGGVILTMFDSRTNLSKEISDEVTKYFGDIVFKSIIPRNIRLSEAPSHGKPIKLYAPESTGAKAYEKLSKELIDRTLY